MVRESPTQNFEGEAAILVTSTSNSVLICGGIHDTINEAKGK